ncbi:MAG: diguanylate cyclase [Chloroflexaceae bacterium]|nr:diguanylate cyclase [Chloroflexaceae bacterium]
MTGEHCVFDAHGMLRRQKWTERAIFDDQHQIIEFQVVSHDMSERKQTGTAEPETALGLEEQLQQSQRLLLSLLDHSPSFVGIRDIEGRYMLCNQSYADLIGHRIEDIIGKTDHELIPEAIAQSLTANDALIISTGQAQKEEISVVLNAMERTFLLSKFPLRNEQGQIYAIGGIATEMTERKDIEKALTEANHQLTLWIKELEQYNREMTLLNWLSETLQQCQQVDQVYQAMQRIIRQLFEQFAVGLHMVDTGEQRYITVASWGDTVFVESHVCDICPALQQDDLLNQKQRALLCNNTFDNEQRRYLCVPVVAQGQAIGVLSMYGIPEKPVHERQHWERLAIMIVDQLSLTLTNLYLREQLHEQAIRDPLTGLFNRRYLNETLRRELSRAQRHQHPLSIMMLDIDHFKSYNDRYGHDGGDVLLQAMGDFLPQQTRKEDVACRFGGEEFTLILPGASLEDTIRRAEKLRADVCLLQVYHQGRPLDSITISLGIACFPLHGNTSEQLIRVADAALYRAKAAGRNRVMIANPYEREV